MTSNPFLSIVIPTYNRVDFLDYCLEVHIPLAKVHNIPIFISDNASTDATGEVVKRRIKEYHLIQYHRNETNLGFDGNFECALKYPQTDYVWLLGDTYQIPPDGIDYVLKLITANKEKYEAIIFNVADRVIDIPQQDYTDQNQLLSDLGWHMTCLSSLVYSSKLITNADFERYKNTDLVQTAIIFESIANRNFLIHWVENFSVKSIKIKDLVKKSWQARTMQIWAEKWPNLILSLPPSYRLDIKMKCIKEHGIKSQTFTLMGLLKLRSENILNFKTYKHYSKIFPLSIDFSNITILIISLLPSTILKFIRALKK